MNLIDAILEATKDGVELRLYQDRERLLVTGLRHGMALQHAVDLSYAKQACMPLDRVLSEIVEDVRYNLKASAAADFGAARCLPRL